YLYFQAEDGIRDARRKTLRLWRSTRIRYASSSPDLALATATLSLSSIHPLDCNVLGRLATHTLTINPVPPLRSSEWFLVGYFAYVAVAGLFFGIGFKPWAVFLLVTTLILVLARRKWIWRDLPPLPLTLLAYREMDWFTPPTRDHHLENAWILQDRQLLDGLHVRAAIESLGPVIPTYLELCYCLVYSVGAVAIALLFTNGRRVLI